MILQNIIYVRVCVCVSEIGGIPAISVNLIVTLLIAQWICYVGRSLKRGLH